MKAAYIIFAIAILSSCGGKSHTHKQEMTPCVVDSIAQIQRSSIEPEPKCEVYLDCGSFFVERPGRSKIGDTIYVQKNQTK